MAAMMRAPHASQVLVLCALSLGVSELRNVTGQDKAEGRRMDEAAIRKVLADYVEAWNEHDLLTAWCELFTDDVDYVNRAGVWWKSKPD
jgi:hypothetical protein